MTTICSHSFSFILLLFTIMILCSCSLTKGYSVENYYPAYLKDDNEIKSKIFGLSSSKLHILHDHLQELIVGQDSNAAIKILEREGFNCTEQTCLWLKSALNMTDSDVKSIRTFVLILSMAQSASLSKGQIQIITKEVPLVKRYDGHSLPE